MMGGGLPETRWASRKYEIKILIHHCILLDFLCELYYDARIHENQVYTRKQFNEHKKSLKRSQLEDC